MTMMSDIEEATRLTRAGRLAEATALLRRAMGGGPAPDAPPAPGPAPRANPFGDRKPRIFDVLPETGDVLPDPLRALHGRLRPQPASPALPEGARFLSLSCRTAAGSRDYRLYIPARALPGPAPLLLMLHGCTQSPEDFAAGTRMNEVAEERGLIVAYPAQVPSANAQKCWNWFNAAEQRREGNEASILAAIARQVMRDHPVDPKRVFVAGLSAGGAAAAILGQAYPDIFAAVGVHSGLPVGAARDIPSAFAAMRQGAPGPAAKRLVPTIVFHADKDATVHPRNGDAVVAQQAGAAGALRLTEERGQVPDGHAFTCRRHRDAEGRAMLEQWVVHGGGHAWSGGDAAGSYTDPRGPDASRAMLDFFAGQTLRR
jgi:poly(hydroxyalkanoate) depolymerase family esterase